MAAPRWRARSRQAALTLPPFLTTGAPPRDPTAPFVAREQELAELTTALATARSGSGQILFVIGGAGRGKTMLVQEFARQAQAADPELLVVSGACNVHIGNGDPYLPFREATTMLSGDVETRWASSLISTCGTLAPAARIGSQRSASDSRRQAVCLRKPGSVPRVAP